jgi:hypothetical protein
VLAAAARDTPTVLILDDLQWADTSTRLLLGHLLRDAEPTRMLIVGTQREDGPALPRAFERIELAGLDAAEIEALVAVHDVPGSSDAFVRRLQEWTEGNPFYIEETLRSLAGASDLSRIVVPAGVKALIGDRLSRLSETAGQVLNVASVIGRDFRLELLEALIEQPVDQIIAALEEATAAGLVCEIPDDADCFVFTQALVREVVYERQSASRRVRLHNRIAMALEEAGPRLAPSPAALAHHFLACRHLDREGKAIGYLVQAAEQATASLAYEDAVAAYRSALTAMSDLALSDECRRCALLLALGHAEARAGDPAARDTFVRAAELAVQERLPEQLAEAALGRANEVHQAGTIDREGIEWLDAALGALGEQESALHARLLARMANLLHFAGQSDRVHALSSRAVEMARRIGDPAALVEALESRHAALLHAHLDERLRLSEELLALARRIGERELECVALHWRSFDLLESGAADAAREHSKALARLADELRQPTYTYFSMRWDSLWAQADDRLEDAARVIEEAEAVGVRAQYPDVHVQAMGARLALGYRQRMLGGFAAMIEASIAENPQLQVNRPALALAHVQAGNRDAATAEFEALAADGFTAFPHDVIWFSTICVLAEVCAGLGDTERAAKLYDLIQPHRGRLVMVGMATCWGSAERYLAMLAAARGDEETARAHAEAALAANEAAGITSMARMVREDFADLLGPPELAVTEIRPRTG